MKNLMYITIYAAFHCNYIFIKILPKNPFKYGKWYNLTKKLVIMNKIQEIFENLKPELTKIDDLILEFSHAKSPLIKEISNHLILSGGKRIRPILLILSAKICNESADNYHNLAAAVELIHTATLLHDDVVDNSEVRRGKKTANALWDNKASILVGDFVFSISFQLMVRSGNIKILDLLAKTSSIMADGEVMQLENSSDINLSEEKYLDIIYGKTAVLFSSSCQAAALLYQKTAQEISALANFGKSLGIVFQIIDDVLDYKASNEEIGKDVGDDFFEGKITLPMIYLYKNANENDKAFVSDLLQKNLMNEQKDAKNLQKVLDLMQKYCVIEECYEFALKYKKQAIESLSIFEDSVYKNYLLEILNYSFSRTK
jgi:octaprenyl-diphosphate synthase